MPPFQWVGTSFEQEIHHVDMQAPDCLGVGFGVNEYVASQRFRVRGQFRATPCVHSKLNDVSIMSVDTIDDFGAAWRGMAGCIGSYMVL